MEELQLKKSLLLLSLVAILGAGCSSTPLDAPADPSSASNYYGVDAASAEALGLEELRGNQLLSQRSVFFDFNSLMYFSYCPGICFNFPSKSTTQSKHFLWVL